MTYKNTKLRSQEPEPLDYVIMLLLIAGTGFDWCFNYKPMLFFIIFPLTFFLYLKRQPKINWGIILFFLVYILWAIFQSVTNTAWSALITLFVRLIICVFIVVTIRDFPKLVIKIMVWISIVSLFMYFITMIPSVQSLFRSYCGGWKPIGGIDPEFTSNPGVSMGFYFMSDGHGVSRFRNSGPFWEPGMFGVFIGIALTLQILRDRHLTRDSYILIAAGISTLSTTTYVSLFVILSYYTIFIIRNKKAVLLVPIIAVGLIAFLNSDFGLSKIQDDVADDGTASRFGAIAYHLSLIAENPLVGRGYASGQGQALLSPNGLTWIYVFWGIPVGVMYYVCLFYGAKKLCENFNRRYLLSNTWVLFLIMMLLSFSQDVTLRDFYMVVAVYAFHSIKIREKYQSNLNTLWYN